MPVRISSSFRKDSSCRAEDVRVKSAELDSVEIPNIDPEHKM